MFKVFHITTHILRQSGQSRINQAGGTEYLSARKLYLSSVLFHKFLFFRYLPCNVILGTPVFLAFDINIRFNAFYNIVNRISFRQHYVIYIFYGFKKLHPHFIIKIRSARSFPHILFRCNRHHQDIAHAFRLFKMNDVAGMNKVKYSMAEYHFLILLFQPLFDCFSVLVPGHYSAH